jgi:hypothetical protein
MGNACAGVITAHFTLHSRFIICVSNTDLVVTKGMTSQLNLLMNTSIKDNLEQLYSNDLLGGELVPTPPESLYQWINIMPTDHSTSDST